MKIPRSLLDTTRESPATSAIQRTGLFRRGDEGSSLIEIALCLPPILLLLTGVFAFGFTVSNDVALTNATDGAAMQVSMSRGVPGLDPCATAAAAVYGAAPTLTQGSFTFSLILNGTTYTGTSCGSGTTAPGNMVQGTPATLTVTYPCNLRTYKGNNFPSCTLTAKSAEIIQ
jgi:hypothetical protein